MGFFTEKMKSLFSSKPNLDELDGLDEGSGEGERARSGAQDGRGPELDGEESARPAVGFSVYTSPELTGAFTQAQQGEEAAPLSSSSRAEGSLLDAPRDIFKSPASESAPDRTLPSDELLFDPDESIEVPSDLVAPYSESRHRRGAILASQPPVEQWLEDDGGEDDELPPETQLHLPLRPPRSHDPDHTIAPPSGQRLPLARLARSAKAQAQPAPSADRPLFRVQREANEPQRIRLEQLLGPVHIPSLQEMSVMMRHWLIEQIELLRSGELELAAADELHDVWHGYFELRPDDHQTKLEYGWYLLDFHGKDAAYDHFKSLYERETSEHFLFALTSLSHRTGDTLGAEQYMNVLYERLPEDLQVLQLKLDIELSLKKQQAAELTQRLIYQIQGRQEGLGGY